MKQQTFIICVLASLAFGCEISHPIDPEIVECKIAGGTWQNSKCICPPDIAASTNQTVCRDGKIYTCSNGLLNLVTQCPGECSDNGKLCNLETGGDGDVCYSDKDEQTSLGYLYSCEDGKCELKTICPLGCNDEVGHENECKKCEDKSVMCQDEYLKTCINGYWDSGVKCLNGCDKEQKICSSKEGYSSEKTNSNCDGDYLETYYVYQNDQSELKERKYCYNGCSVNNGVAECISCEPNKLACDGNVLKICNENNVWVDKETCPWECSHGVCTCETNQTKCENNTLYICNDGYQTQISCPWGCGSDNKCKCDETERKTECNGNILFTCEYGNVIETYCASGCENGACKTTENECTHGETQCSVDNKVQICEGEKWKETGEITICKDNISYYSCIDGSIKETLCDDNTYCKEGKCIACEDGKTQCSVDNKVQICEGEKWKEYNEITCKDNISYSCNNGSIEEENCDNGCNAANTACNINTNITCLMGSYIDGNCYCQNDSTVEICTTDCGSTGCYPAEHCSENMCLFDSLLYICDESSGSLKKVQELSYYTPDYYTPESSSNVNLKDVFDNTQNETPICKLNNKILFALKDNLLNSATSQEKRSLRFETHSDDSDNYQWQIDYDESQNSELTISVNSQNKDCNGKNTKFNPDNFDLCNIFNSEVCWGDALDHLKNNFMTNFKFAITDNDYNDYKDIRVDVSGITCNSNNITFPQFDFNVDMLNVDVYGCDGNVCDTCVPGQYQCNENTLKFCKELNTPRWIEINCANGCSNGACNPCDETTTKCEDNMKYKCNGNDQWSDPKPCPNGCDKDGKTCAKACDENSIKSYSDWYNLLKHNSNSISNLNSLIMDMYLFNCQNLQETGQWSVFEFNNDVNSNEAEKSIFVIISKENGRCDYDIKQDSFETVDISEMESSVCDYLENCNGNCKIKELTGKLSYQYKCEIPSGGSKNVKTCKEEMKLENLDNLNNILIYGTCNNGEWNQFKIKPDATPAMICPNY